MYIRGTRPRRQDPVEREPEHVLVIGGTQFIGTHCVEALLAAGYSVTVLNRGASPWPFGDADVARIACDVFDDPEGVARAVAARPWRAVVNFVCFAAEHARVVAAACAAQDPTPCAPGVP